MFHFPSTLQQGPSSASTRSEALNATQQKPSARPIFVKVEEELHDARRVHADGQEDDLRYALNMVINRVTELSSMLSEAYKAQAELEVQLNVAKSNLKLVIANNEMLEDALKQNMSAQSKDIGWNRTNRRNGGDLKEARTIPERSQSVDIPIPLQVEPTGSPTSTTNSTPSHTQQDNRFFKFRFSTPAVTLTRPMTPSGQHSNSPTASHLTSPSLPSLSSVKSKEIEALTAELDKQKAGHKKIKEEKAALEAELESLSQALFEEANKMVADERRLRAETEEELKELKMEKEALQSALRLVAGEGNVPPLTSDDTTSSAEDRLTPVGVQTVISSTISSHSRTSSQVGIKSRPQSFELALMHPLPASPAPYSEELPVWREESTYEETPLKENGPLSLPAVLSSDDEPQSTTHFQPPIPDDLLIEASPWADAVSNSTSPKLILVAPASAQ